MGRKNWGSVNECEWENKDTRKILRIVTVNVLMDETAELNEYDIYLENDFLNTFRKLQDAIEFCNEYMKKN